MKPKFLALVFGVLALPVMAADQNATGCNELSGTYAGAFSVQGKTIPMNWRFSPNGSQIVIYSLENAGSPKGTGDCAFDGQSFVIQNFQFELTPNLRQSGLFQLSPDKKYLTGTWATTSAKTGQLTAIRTENPTTEVPSIKLDEGINTEVDMDTVGVSKSFSFKGKKK